VDDWLVRMVGLLAAVIGATLAAQRRTSSIEIVTLAIGSALAFRRSTSGTPCGWFRDLPGDAVVELALVALLIVTSRSD
jgi:hypothetical protein